MWKQEIIDNIKKTQFDINNLFINPDASKHINRDEYINIILNDFLIELRKEIIKNDAIETLDLLETKINDSIEYTNFKNYKSNEFDCNTNTAKSILSYIYWKYKNPKNTLKSHANMTYIKKILGFENIHIEKLLQPISLLAKCYICGGSAIIKIPSYEHNRIIFKCNDCEHFYETASSTNNDIAKFENTNYVRCNCNLCTHIKKSIYDKCIQWFNTLKNECDKTTKNYSKNIHSINNLLRERNLMYQINCENLLMSYVLGSFNRLDTLTFNEFSNYISSGKFLETYHIANHDYKNSYKNIDTHGYNFIFCENFDILSDINIDELKNIIFELDESLNSNILTQKDDSKMIQNNFILELSFATPSSYIFNAINSYGKNIEVHVHLGQYNVIHINMIVSDHSIMINQDRKSLAYLDTLILNISMQIFNITGFLSKSTDIETYFSINFNSIRINFPPCFMSDKDDTYKYIERNLSEVVFSEIQKLPKSELY